jgi:geranylgeranyl pyrophosphate synthase
MVERESAMAVSELARVLALPSLERDLKAVDRRVADALAPFSAVLGESLTPVVGPAKRLRPTMTIACGQLGGHGVDKRLVTAGAAVELVQIGSLIHDDVLEDAATRRGQPTLNASEGVPVALVVGDLILSSACVLAADVGEYPAELLSDAMTKMCAGQLAELRDAFDVERTEDAYLASVEGKTGALFAAACRVGGMVAGMPPRQLKAISEYGLTFGVAFQMVDDLLDLAGDPAKLGKPIGMDMTAGVYTAPVIHALNVRGGKTLARLLRERKLGEATRRVLSSPAVGDTEQRVYELADEASEWLRIFGDHPVAAGLRRFPRYYIDWALRELRAV